MPVVITLVHGTFGRLPGRDAGWTREVSALRQRLCAELPETPVFVPFRWSGMNWPGARYRAAERLRRHFLDVAERYPGWHHYVIAHSHGGNVTLYALRETADSHAVALPAGVVCLSTPFIAAQPRPVTLTRYTATYTVLLVSLFAVVANTVGWFLMPWLVASGGADGVMKVLLLNQIWLEFGACALAAWFATEGLVKMARRRWRRIVVDTIEVPLFIHRSLGDEASAALATSSFLTWLNALAWNLASLATLLIAGLFAFIVLWPVLAVITGALAVERLLGGGRLMSAVRGVTRSRRVWAGIAAIGMLGAFALWGWFFAGTPLGTLEQDYAVWVAVMVAAAISFSTLSGLGYGLTSPFLEVTAESTPVGRWAIHLSPARTGGSDAVLADRAAIRAAYPSSLAHSAGYIDENVLDAISDWIRRREAASSQ